MIYFIGDAQLDDRDPSRQQTAAAIAECLGLSVVFDVGDLAERALATEYAAYASIFPESCAVPGNHDYYAIGAWPYPERLVDVAYDGLHLVGFDSSQRLDPLHRNWLTAALAGGGATPRVLFLHHPLYSANLRVGQIATSMRAALLPFVEAADVRLIISGHGHAYERHEAGGRTFLVIGTAGAPLDQVGQAETLKAAISAHGWLEVQLHPGRIACRWQALVDGRYDSFDVKLPIPTGKTPRFTMD